MQILLKWIDKFIKLPTVPPMNEEQEFGLFSQLAENGTFQKYLDARERYLVLKHTEDFLSGKINNAYGLAGQLLEIRSLRSRVKIVYNIVDKRRKAVALKKEQVKN